MHFQAIVFGDPEKRLAIDKDCCLLICEHVTLIALHRY